MAFGFFVWLGRQYMAHELFYVFDRQSNSFRFLDFDNSYMCAKLAASPLRHAVYDPASQLSFFKQWLAPLQITTSPYCQVVPWYFVFAIPFGLFPLPVAYVIWNLLFCSFGIIGLRQLMRYLGRFDRKERIFLYVWLFAFFPAQAAIFDGQNSWFLLGLSALYCKFWLESRDTPCGIVLSFVTVKPQYFLYLLIPAIAQRRWRILAVALFSCLVFLVISGLVIGFDNIVNYPKVLTRIESGDLAVYPRHMVSIRGPVSILLGQNLGFQIGTGIFFLSMILLFFMWLRTPKTAVLPAFAATIMGMVVFSPHTHPYDLTFMALPFVLIAPSLKNKDILRSLPGYHRLCISIFVFLPILIYFPLVGLFSFAPKDSVAHGEPLAWTFSLINLLLLFLIIGQWQSAKKQPGSEQGSEL
jgi:hypothetical protein